MADFFKKIISLYKKPFVRFPIIALAVLLVLWGILRSCSSSDTEKSEYYKIGRDVSWYPFELLGKEQNMVGFTNDLISEIAAREKIKLEIVDVTSKSLFFGLDRGNWDAVLSSLTPDVYNQQKYEFSKPFYASGIVLVVKPNSTLQSMSDIRGKIIGIPKGLSLAPAVVQADAIFTPYSKMSQAVEDMIANRLDAVLLDYVIAQLYAQGVYSGKIKLATAPILSDALRLVARKTPDGMLIVNAFNNGLEKLVKDGSFEKLLIKWSLGNP